MMASSRTLVIQPLPGIGDAVWFAPYLKALARQTPTQRITLLTKQRSQSDHIFGHEDFIEECIWLDTIVPHSSYVKNIHKLGHYLRQHQFSDVWILHHSPRYALACALAKIPRRYGYGFGSQRLLLNQGSFLHRRLKSHLAVERAAQFFTLNGVSVQEDDHFISACSKAREDIRERFSSQPHPWICLGVGSSDPSRMWPTGSFIELGRWLGQSHQNTIFVCGSPTEAALVHEITNGIAEQGNQKHIIPVCDLSLKHIMALLQESDHFIGNDSGLMNLAARLNRPTIGLFGTTPPLQYVPNLHAINPPMGQSGMDRISVDQVREYVTSGNTYTDATDETLHLLKSPNNARRLYESLESLKKKDLIEE